MQSRDSANDSAEYYNRAGAAEFMRRLSDETLLMQGPMGSMLMSEPGAEDIPPAFWNLAEPQTVRRIHQLYEAAGAQVLLTNTFQASAPALERDGIAPSAAEVNRAAVDNARAVHGEVVVGSIGPCGIEWTREDSPEFRAARAAYREQATALLTAGVDAVIVADLGAFTLAGKYAPNCQRHISTQASISNYVTANAWYDLGASRVILARELSLEEIRTIRENTPAELEIEAFVHGAMCVSYSGRCLLSNYMTGRDASRGACAQPCRYQYALMEEKRPGEYFPIEEDEKGSYILNSRDMCMIDHLDDLLDVGLSSLKIEGRAKSAYYAAIVTGAYRHCLDDAAAGRPIDPVWRDEVEHVSHRPYATGFYYGYPGQYYENSRYIREWQVVALVTECDSDGNAVISLRNKFRTGDTVELVGPDLRPFSMTVPEMRDEAGTVIEEPRNPQMLLKLRLPRPVPPMTLVRHQVELSAK